MTWGEAIFQALCHYADTGQRCRVWLCPERGWRVSEVYRGAYRRGCACFDCRGVRAKRTAWKRPGVR